MINVGKSVIYRVRNSVRGRVRKQVKLRIWIHIGDLIGDSTRPRVWILVEASVAGSVRSPQLIPRSVMTSALGSIEEAS
jgi:hypothetical protein